MCVTCLRVLWHEAARDQPTTLHGVSVWYSRVKPLSWKHKCLHNDCLVWYEFQKQNTFRVPKTVAMNFPADCCTWNFLGVADPLSFYCMDSYLVSGSLWWTNVSSLVIIFEMNFSGFALKTSTLSSLNYWWHDFCSGVHIRGTHRELTFDIIKTKWMIQETVPAEIPSSWGI